MKKKALRQTMPIQDLKDFANGLLADDDLSEVTKQKIWGAASDLLHEYGQYRGFQHLDWANHGYKAWVEAGKPRDNSKYIGREYARKLS